MKLLTPLLKLRRNTSGATAIEYCLIAGIICLAIIGGATATGSAVNGSFNKATAGFTPAP
jgi:pilus assembly protein Flp/PilA